jgi:sporulation protein YlmC with PRC-barrel domain
MTVLSADTLKNESVINPQGEDLGDIKDFMLNTDSGEVEYAVLSFGGFMNMGDKLFAVPMTALKLDTDRKCFILNADKEQLKDAPGFDKDNWPNFADPSITQTFDTYYSRH